MHSSTAKRDFLQRFKSSSVTSHNIGLLLDADPGGGNLKTGSVKGHAGGWQRSGHETWLQSANGDYIHHFGPTNGDMKPYVEAIKQLRGDVDFKDLNRLGQVVRGSLRAGGKIKAEQDVYATLPDEMLLKWIKVERPSDAETRIRSGQGAHARKHARKPSARARRT
jgi:hypothetical protein